MLPGNDLSPVWVAALKSPIQIDQPHPIEFQLHGVKYATFRPLALQTIDGMPIEPEPNIDLSSISTFAARIPFTTKKVQGFKKPDKTALEELRAALIRCYTEQVSVDRMLDVWNFELTQSVMGV